MRSSTLKVAATYIGAVMGAGFASGQEIFQFFIVYQNKGLWGTALAGILFAMFGVMVLKVIRAHGIQSYQELFILLLGRRLGKICEAFVTLFLFAGLIVMLAGSGAVFSEYFNLGATYGILLTASAVLLALASKGEGVIWINSILIPLKLVICIMVCFAALRVVPELNGDIIPVIHRPWYVSALLYVSFNMTFAIVVLASLGKEIKGNILGGLLGGLGLGFFALTIGSALLHFYPGIGKYQVPMVTISFQIGTQMGVFYLLLLWFAMITAAVGNAFSLVKRITPIFRLDYWLLCLITVGLAVPMAHFKFSTLVGIVYPVFGYIGLLVLGPIIYLALGGKEGKSR